MKTIILSNYRTVKRTHTVKHTSIEMEPQKQRTPYQLIESLEKLMLMSVEGVKLHRAIQLNDNGPRYVTGHSASCLEIYLCIEHLKAGSLLWEDTITCVYFRLPVLRH